MKKLLFAVLLILSFETFISAQIPSGIDPVLTFRTDSGYNAVTVRNPVVLGDNIGRIEFAGWVTSMKYQSGASIRARVSGTPTANTVPAELIFSTGATDRLKILENGNVGVNNANPDARFSVREFFSNGNPDKPIFEVAGGNGSGSQKNFRISTYNGLLKAYLQGSMEIESGDMIIKNGRLGIGVEPNDLPGNHKLYVNGSILCSELKIEEKGSWPDFVFVKNYPLMPLYKIESYINEQHHLPNVPSEQQVKQNGIEVGEMQKILLQKIEELTLYVIQQQKEIDNLKNSGQQSRAKRKW